MTQTQRQVMKVLRDKNIGSFFFGGKWIFTDDVRNDTELAEQIAKLDWIGIRR